MSAIQGVGQRVGETPTQCEACKRHGRSTGAASAYQYGLSTGQGGGLFTTKRDLASDNYSDVYANISASPTGKTSERSVNPPLHAQWQQGRLCSLTDKRVFRIFVENNSPFGQIDIHFTHLLR
jgi:hypothetical protein